MSDKMKEANEKYTNYYVEILKQNLSEQILYNISLKASSKVDYEISQELKQKLEALVEQQNKVFLQEEIIKSDYEKLKNENENQKAQIEALKTENTNIKSNLSEASKFRNEYNRINSECDSLKSQVAHLDIFRKQLLEKENIIGELNQQIELLENASKKKKMVIPKIVEVNLPPPKVVSTKPETTVEDGGNF